MRYEYFLCLLLLLLIALFLKFKFKITVFTSAKQTLVFYTVVFVIGTIWDNFSVWRGHWYYPGKGIVGLFIGLIPIEDYFFAIVTTFTVLVLYRVVQKTLK
jgi:lycopene cyclase domain-containing protein